MVDPNLPYLYYLQMKNDVVTGRNPIPVSLAIQLAAHQLQIEVGDHAPGKHRTGFIQEQIDAFFPPRIYENENKQLLEARTFSHHRKLTGTPRERAISGYLREMKRSTLLDAPFFIPLSGMLEFVRMAFFLFVAIKDWIWR